MALSLRLLGRFELTTDTGAPIDVPGARVQLLLALLALSPGATHDRVRVSSLFWGDRQDQQARASLRQAIWALRRALGEAAPLLWADGDMIGIDPDRLATDVAEFEAKARSDDAATLQAAAALYRGDLLEDFDLVRLAPDGPFLDRRERLRELALDCLRRLVALETHSGRLDEAAEAARRSLKIDPLQEDLHRALIILHLRCGRPAQAQAQYETCRAVLVSELGIEPAAETRQALRQPMTAGRPAPLAPATAAQSGAGADLAAIAPSAPSVAARPSLFNRLMAASLAVGLLVSGAYAVLNRTGDGAPPPLSDATPSVAVFPFADLSVNSQQLEYAAALTADLITDLSRVAGLLVISNDTTAALSAGTTEAARALGVQYVVKGSVRRSRGQVRINVQLVDVMDGRHIWAENYDRDLAQLFTLQDEVVESIVDSLRVRLSERERLAITRIPTHNLEAYDHYMRAEQQRFTSTEAVRFRQVLAGYRRAIELDPGFAEAYAGYARAAVQIWRRGFDDVMTGAIARRAAYEAAEKALSLDPESARAYGVLSSMQATDGEFESAVASAKRAVELQPGDADTHAQLAYILSVAGNTGEATAEIALARRLNPILPPDLLLISGAVAFAGGRYQDAITDLSQARPALPTSEMLLQYLAAAQALSGDSATARDTARELIAVMPLANLELLAFVNHAPGIEVPLLKGLQLAGIPRWPFGFIAAEEDRVTEPELDRIAVAPLWTGRLSNGVGFVQETDSRGIFAYRSERSLLTGKQFARDGRLCQRIDGYLSRREICGYVYKGGRVAGDMPFVFVSIDGVKFFDIAN